MGWKVNAMKKILFVLAALIAIAFVASAGCSESKSTTVVAGEQMFINGTITDIRYTPVAYNDFSAYHVIFADGNWTIIGTPGVRSTFARAESLMQYWGYDKIDPGGLVGRLKFGHDCSMLFEKDSNGFWLLVGVEIS